MHHMMYIWYSSKVTLETLKAYSHVSCSLVTHTHCSQCQVLSWQSQSLYTKFNDG